MSKFASSNNMGGGGGGKQFGAVFKKKQTGILTKGLTKTNFGVTEPKQEVQQVEKNNKNNEAVKTGAGTILDDDFETELRKL